MFFEVILDPSNPLSLQESYSHSQCFEHIDKLTRKNLHLLKISSLIRVVHSYSRFQTLLKYQLLKSPPTWNSLITYYYCTQFFFYIRLICIYWSLSIFLASILRAELYCKIFQIDISFPCLYPPCSPKMELLLEMGTQPEIFISLANTFDINCASCKP